MWAVVGASGVGLVWGWLLATLGVVQRPTATFIAVAIATALFLAEVIAFGGVLASLGFVAAACVGVAGHLGLREAIRARRVAMEGEG